MLTRAFQRSLHTTTNMMTIAIASTYTRVSKECNVLYEHGLGWSLKQCGTSRFTTFPTLGV